MQLNRIQASSYTMAFSGRFRMPVSLKRILNFEQNIAPLFEHTINKPIKAFYDRFSITKL